VADHHRPQARSVEDELYGDASRFTFLQAVRLVEEIELRKRPGRRKPPGEAAHAEDELLFFRHFVRLDMPATDVDSLERGAGSDPPTMTTNVLGLAGLFGPLPHTVTELVIDQLWHGERHPPHHRPPRELADFLDIFNHRLLSLLYRARKKFRPALDPDGPHKGRMARVLYAFLGLGSPRLQGRVLHRDHDRPLLGYAGLFAERYRSRAGLERVLEEHFAVPATVVPFIGAWDEIEPGDWTAIGATSGRNNALGSSAFIGRRVWNQAARFEVQLGPLDFRRVVSFLPSAHDAHAPLLSLIHFYAHEELGFDVRLIIEGAQIPKLKLSRGHGAYLGHTSWLSRHPPKCDDDQVRLAGRR
jgi:type VI secretion system protein ImpH